MKKKKVNVKTTKNVGKKSIKSPKKVVKRVSKVNKQSAVIVDTPRNFWGLFSNVKNHNFRSMMQKGNYLQDFIKLVEGMPEKQFQKVFIEPCDLNPQRVWQKIDCGCPENIQCLCAKEKLVRNSNYYFDYLVECKLDRYEVEIQHLRYLIELQRKSTQVPSSYSMDEFLKRSGAPERPKINSYAGIVELVVEEENKDSKSLFGGASTEVKDEKKENSLEEILKKYTEKKKQDADKDVRPALKDLKNTTPKNLGKESEDIKLADLRTNIEDICRLSEIVNDRLEEVHEVKQKEPNGAFALNSALQTLVKYADILDDNTPKVVTTEASLPPFWQELKTARELFEKFDDFYAQKQVESVLALREINHEKEKLLKTSGEGYLTSLHYDIKKYLKAERELKVLKKVLKTAYQQFFDAETVQADLDYLKREMTYYTNTAGVSDLSVDSLWPNKNKKTTFKKKDISPDSKIRRCPDINKNKQENVVVGESTKMDHSSAPYSRVEEMMAENIQKCISLGIITTKDFDQLISYGLDRNCVECWKYKYAHGDLVTLNSTQGWMEPV